MGDKGEFWAIEGTYPDDPEWLPDVVFGWRNTISEKAMNRGREGQELLKAGRLSSDDFLHLLVSLMEEESPICVEETVE
jgi:hypothetical protein